MGQERENLDWAFLCTTREDKGLFALGGLGGFIAIYVAFAADVKPSVHAHVWYILAGSILFAISGLVVKHRR